jgi:hypothetical protein
MGAGYLWANYTVNTEASLPFIFGGGNGDFCFSGEFYMIVRGRPEFSVTVFPS